MHEPKSVTISISKLLLGLAKVVGWIWVGFGVFGIIFAIKQEIPKAFETGDAGLLVGLVIFVGVITLPGILLLAIGYKRIHFTL